jgi:hypothetical protein
LAIGQDSVPFKTSISMLMAFSPSARPVGTRRGRQLRFPHGLIAAL